jgi:hypothetical protein
MTEFLEMSVAFVLARLLGVTRKFPRFDSDGDSRPDYPNWGEEFLDDAPAAQSNPDLVMGRGYGANILALAKSPRAHPTHLTRTHP